MGKNEVAGISEKQMNWLISTAKREGHKIAEHPYIIYMKDCHYKISNARRLASGGSYVATGVVPGRYKMEKLYTIKFDSTGLTGVYSRCDLDYFRTTEHTFTIINQLDK